MYRRCNSDTFLGWKSVEAVDKGILVAPRRYYLILLVDDISIEFQAILQGHLHIDLVLPCDVVGKASVPGLSMFNELGIIPALFPEPLG
jgi:hypothetical protein